MVMVFIYQAAELGREARSSLTAPKLVAGAAAAAGA